MQCGADSWHDPWNLSGMLTTTLFFVSLAIALTFPRTAVAVVGACLAVVAVSVASSWVALSALIVAVAVVVAMADSGAVDTGYLERAPVERRTAVRFLTPVWDDVVDDAEADRLLAMWSRAIASRHIARAAKYRARYLAHLLTMESRNAVNG